MDPVTIAAVGWGISSAGWLISPIISNLLNKCFSSLGHHSLDRNKHKKLESQVRRLKQMLDAAEAIRPRPDQVATLKQWTQNLKSAFYEAEDILDEIDYDHLESRILSQTPGKSAVTASQYNTTQDIGTITDFGVNRLSRPKLEGALNMIEKLIDDGEELLSSLKLASSYDNIKSTANYTASERSSVMRSQTTSAPPADVFGRDRDLKMIKRMLRDSPTHDQPSSSAKCFSVIGIHGIPGSGKTTLAQYVCSDEKKYHHFNLFMWIHVSRNFSVDTVFAEMLEIASDGVTRSLPSNLDKLQAELETHIRGKRFLLVLDDVWYEKDKKDLIEQQQQLDLLLSPLKAGEMGSKVLVTTRTADAARALGAHYLVAISDLDEEQFLSMFMHYALHGAENNNQASKTMYWSIGEKIARKLGRSPLAAKAVACQLKTKPEVAFWIRTMNSDLLNKETVGALWWSYQQLDEHVKQCFTYCSIFPRRYELQRDELVHLWMAEGFVKSTSTTKDIEDVGHDYFHLLLSASFIQLKENSFGKQFYTIHDLLHDLAGIAAGSDCFKIEEGMSNNVPQDVMHIFVLSYDQRVFEEQILNLKSLRTVIMSSNVNMPYEDLNRLLNSLKKLRVVHVNVSDRFLQIRQGWEQKHLRYLGLFGEPYNIILPPQFTKLYHLQKFAAADRCQLHYSTPNSMANLVNLRHMTLAELLCPDIGRLTLLRTLSGFRVSKIRGYEIQQLEFLDKLRGTLTIRGLENVSGNEEARRAKLENKVYLSGLVLKWCNYHDESTELMLQTQEGTLEALRPSNLIRSLKICNYRASTYPSWVTGEEEALINLQHLMFEDCYAPPNFGESFICLRKLVIFGCRWQFIPENIECLPCLEELIIEHCKYIKPLPRLPLSLMKLLLRYWSGSTLPENMESLTSLEELTLRGCNNLLVLPRLPPSLKKLAIINCHRSLIDTCWEDGHPNMDKIVHIQKKWIF